MAVQSLYRRYRPQRFSELKGQEHVVRALKNAVATSREGHAYLFSGPRGTGKTTTARILAKVLNCASPVDGEPCCACDSCLAVQSGSSFDVIELDAASNNGVENIRDLIQSAVLGSPGRHKVIILDEVHMLSRGASAALLKTLEEPPGDVVFVLATTDPHKVPETIRSRTQHLQFHLLPADVLESHVREVAADAGIDLADDAIQSVVRQGGGSARDTLSALELAAATGGVLDEVTPVDEYVEALAAFDPGRLLAAVAHTVRFGRDPRSITEDLVRHLRDCFLSQMAPELVQLTESRAAEVAEQAGRLGTARIVKCIETLGSALVDMRNAPDQRVILEVALMRLVHKELQVGVEALLSRVERLERELENRPVQLAPAPVNPSTGRAVLGGRAGRDASAPVARSDAPAPSAAAPKSESTAAPTTESAPTTPEVPAVSGGRGDAAKAVSAWTSEVLGGLKGMKKAVAATARPVERDGAVVLTVDNEPTADRVKNFLADISVVIHSVAGGKVPVTVEVRRDDSKPARRPKPVEDEVVDIDEVKSLPSVTDTDITNELSEMFPGSSLRDEGA